MAAQDRERRRIARDLHDVSLQELAAVSTGLRALARSAENAGLPDVRSDADSCLNLVLKIQYDIRTLSYFLHPPLLEMVGLAGALEEYAAGLGRRGPFQVQGRLSRPVRRISHQAECALFRVAQEALTNAWRHSGALGATIELEEFPDRLVLSVTDTGHGFPRGGKRRCRAGVGIASMAERMYLLGGELIIRSGRSGTCVQAILPLTSGSPAIARSGSAGGQGRIDEPDQAELPRLVHRPRPRRQPRAGTDGVRRGLDPAI